MYTSKIITRPDGSKYVQCKSTKTLKASKIIKCLLTEKAVAEFGSSS